MAIFTSNDSQSGGEAAGRTTDGGRDAARSGNGGSGGGSDGGAPLDVVVIGPIGAGKTTLIKALRHPADSAHSYAGRFTVEALDAAAGGASAMAQGAPEDADASSPTEAAGPSAKRSLLSRLSLRKTAPEKLRSVPPTPERRFAEQTRRGPEDAAASYARQLRGDVAEGLRGAATAAALTPIPFTLVLREQTPPSSRRRASGPIEFSITAVDTKGGVFAESPEDKPKELRGAFEQEQRAALERLARADAALVCLPAEEPELDPSRRRSMQTLLAQLAKVWSAAAQADPARRFRVVVAVTKFERLFLSAGRKAFLSAFDRATASAAVAEALQGSWGWLTPRLQELAAAPHVTLRVQPVSAFGFIPGDGGANLDPSTGLLRTRPFADPAVERAHAPEGPTLDAPYTFEAVFAHYWRPFLVLDPFIQLATGIDGALTFALDGTEAGARR
ncbi:MAG: hypothetical protein AAFW46_01435 [Pseudomonadota bacterium]